MPRALTLVLCAVLVAGCRSASPAKSNVPPAPPTPAEHSLSGLAAQRIVVLPTYRIRVEPALGWDAAVGRQEDLARTLDADIAAALDEHGVRKNWILPSDLQQSYRRNASYATDPYNLAEEPLRAPSFTADQRLPEPLASQLRTVIALHDDARLVLAPVELHLEPATSGGRGVLRLVLVDPRFSVVRWWGNISSDSVPAFGPAITASIAAKLAGIVAPR